MSFQRRITLLSALAVADRDRGRRRGRLADRAIGAARPDRRLADRASREMPEHRRRPRRPLACRCPPPSAARSAPAAGETPTPAIAVDSLGCSDRRHTVIPARRLRRPEPGRRRKPSARWSTPTATSSSAPEPGRRSSCRPSRRRRARVGIRRDPAQRRDGRRRRRAGGAWHHSRPAAALVHRPIAAGGRRLALAAGAGHAVRCDRRRRCCRRRSAGRSRGRPWPRRGG